MMVVGTKNSTLVHSSIITINLINFQIFTENVKINNSSKNMHAYNL